MSPVFEADQTTLLSCQWVAPMDRPIMRDGGVVFGGGVILNVGDSGAMRRRYPQAAVQMLPRTLLLPGLVNAHVHLELSNHRPGEPPPRFVDWLKRLAPRTMPAPEQLKSGIEAAVEEGVRQCMQFGVTTVGDISRLPSFSRPVLKQHPLRAVSFGEVLAMAQRRHFLAERVAAASDEHDRTDRLEIGISPHAPYSVEIDGYRKCLEIARAQSIPLATHLAETSEEGQFLADHTGPFRELWDYLGAWDDNVPRFAGGPIRFADAVGLLDYPTLLAHVNYCDDAELSLLARGRASVVYCPRTHAYFGHPPHRWRQMLAAGINVAVGTDSTASSPDLNLVDDLRLLHRIAPDVPAVTLWEMATIRPARSLQLHNRVGSLTPTKAADFVAFEVETDHPLEEVLENASMPARVWLDGRSIEARKSF